MEAQIEEAIKFRKKANFKILTRLSQIIDQYPYLRFHQILMIYKISELGVDKFNEERISQLKITLPTNLLGIFEEIRRSFL